MRPRIEDTMHPLRVAVALCAALPLTAQESVRELEQPGEHHKHLTVDTVDRWLFDGRAGEIVRVDVSSSEFDPVLELVELEDEGDRIARVIVAEVDDPGSQSHMLTRLTEDGRIAILVHGPGNRGGGNYRLYVERLTSVPLPEGATHVKGFVDDSGVAHVRFAATAGETVVPVGAGVAELIDPKGYSLSGWEGCYDVERTGEHYVRVCREPGTPFRVGIRLGRRRELPESAQREETLPANGLDEWMFTGAADDFRTLVVDGDRLALRVTPWGDSARSTAIDGRPPMRWIPVHSKGSTHRFAFVLGRSGSFRVQVRSLAPREAPYRLRFGDTGRGLAAGVRIDSELPIGGSEFYTFPTEPGQVLRVDVTSTTFDPVLRLTTAPGAPLGDNDDGGAGLACRYGFLVTRGGTARAQVASFGDGGGGAYRILLTDVPVPVLTPGEPATGTLGATEGAYWHLTGAAGTDLFLSARSTSVDTALRLFDPNGVLIGSDDDSGADRDALLAVRLPRDGRYTVEVRSRSGEGSYLLQALDPDRIR